METGAQTPLFDELETGQRLNGVVPGEAVQLVSVLRHGGDVAELVYRTGAGSLGSRVLNRSEAGGLAMAISAARPFDADPTQFKLAAETQRIQLAGLFDPMLAERVLIRPPSWTRV